MEKKSVELFSHSSRCSIDGVDDKRIISMQIDSKSHSLFVAFTSCVVKVPLSRCERHGKCKKWVWLSSHYKVISDINNRVLSLREDVRWEQYEKRLESTLLSSLILVKDTEIERLCVSLSQVLYRLQGSVLRLGVGRRVSGNHKHKVCYSKPYTSTLSWYCICLNPSISF